MSRSKLEIREFVNEKIHTLIYVVYFGMLLYSFIGLSGMHPVLLIIIFYVWMIPTLCLIFNTRNQIRDILMELDEDDERD